MNALSVAAIVLGILLLQAAIAIPILIWLRRRNARLTASLGAELAAAGERILLDPEPGSYRGGSARFPSAKGNAVLALTERRLLCRRLVGEPIEVPLAEVEEVREDRWFLRAYAGGRLQLILKLASGAEVGFLVRDQTRWMTAIRDAIRREPG